jgi:16S rRNA processing protein RimM
MTKNDCFQLGKITKTHGLKGEVIVWLDVDFPEEYEEMDSVFLDVKGELVPYFFEELQLKGKKSIAKFENINTFEAAQAIVNLDMYLPLDTLPDLDDDQFYYHDVIGYKVFDENSNQMLGEVKAIYEAVQQDLIAVMFEGKEILIPIADSIVLRADHTEKQIVVSLPDGLLDVYLTDK